ncbi:hypothetical protein AN958_00987 [Leucoagaricus sp. SymC.cos]|nr:hypothetical protein AN958_00987 [Leucoagaricus sp. SymC.cos]
MESVLFLDSCSLPLNMRFEVHSVADLPIALSNEFTVVHQSLVVVGLRRPEWEQAINEIHRVLKAGDWDQLFEFRVWTAGPALAKQLELMYWHLDAKGTMWRDITRLLPDFLARSGFINVLEDTRRTALGAWADQDGIDMKVNLLEIMQGSKTPVLKGGG